MSLALEPRDLGLLNFAHHCEQLPTNHLAGAELAQEYKSFDIFCMSESCEEKRIGLELHVRLRVQRQVPGNQRKISFQPLECLIPLNVSVFCL